MNLIDGKLLRDKILASLKTEVEKKSLQLNLRNPPSGRVRYSPVAGCDRGVCIIWWGYHLYLSAQSAEYGSNRNAGSLLKVVAEKDILWNSNDGF